MQHRHGSIDIILHFGAARRGEIHLSELFHIPGGVLVFLRPGCRDYREQSHQKQMEAMQTFHGISPLSVRLSGPRHQVREGSHGRYRVRVDRDETDGTADAEETHGGAADVQVHMDLGAGDDADIVAGADDRPAADGGPRTS